MRLHRIPNGTVPKTKRRHIQGYVYYANGKTLARARKIFLGADVRIANKSAKINLEYCTKFETRIQNGHSNVRGTMPEQGARTDIFIALDDIEAGMNDFDMFRKHGMLWARYGESLKRHRMAMVKPRDFWTQTLVLWGDTGRGKSRRAYWNASHTPGPVATMLLPKDQKSMVWCDGLIGADTIIIEDMELPGNFPYGILKNMLDWTPCIMPVKGMHMQWAPHYVIITSNHHPCNWYADKDGVWDNEHNALCRRLTTNGSKIVHVLHKWKPPTEGDADLGDPQSFEEKKE